MRRRRDFVEELESADWASLEFKEATLGDSRLDKRLVSMAGDWAQRPGAPMAQALPSKAKLKAAYRFLENDFVQSESILLGHFVATMVRLEREPVVLVPSDTTSFNFSHLPRTQGLGPIGPKGFTNQRGLWLHSTQAFTPQGLPLGLIAAQCWSREGKATDRRHHTQKPLEEKESVRWRDSWEACQEVRRYMPAAMRLVNIDDMEGDIYEVFAAVLAQPAPRAELLVRSQFNRKLEQKDQRLWDHLARQPLAGTLKVQVPRHEQEPARLATLQIRFGPVLLEAPAHKRRQPPLQLWAVEAREEHLPKGAKPIVWRLLSTLPVTTAKEAMEKVRWYSVRWGIEVFHKIVKSVCRAEAHQMETARRLERLLMIKLVVAWRTQVLTQVGRHYPELPATDYFTPSEWQVLYSYIHPQQRLPTRAPSLGQMTEWIGRLGGFVKNRANPYPGAITLGRGLARLSDMAAIWSIQHAKTK